MPLVWSCLGLADFIMEITQEALQEFKAIWIQQNPGSHITELELIKQASNLLLAVKLVYKNLPNPEKQYEHKS